MPRIGGGFLRRAGTRLRDDLDADPYLPYILALAFVLAGFWFWHLIPNFATRDEVFRLLDPMVAFGTVLSDPSIESLRTGVRFGRLYGATFYLFGLAVVPVILIAALTGQLSLFTALPGSNYEFGRFDMWHPTPEWVWVVALVFVRLFNVVFAVGAVYLTYRIATAIRDRSTGRLAALLLTFTWGFLTIAHEGGEDMPALFFLLLALYLLIGYVYTGADWRFYAASASGAAAIAFKLTAAPVVLAVGLAFLLRVREADDWREALFRPGTVVVGALLGFVVITLGFPSVLVAGYDPLFERALSSSADRTQRAFGPDAPIWWWFLRGYFSGLSLPLFVAAVGGVLAGVYQLWDEPREASGIVLVLFLIGANVLLLSRWHDFRVHHLLPTFPLLMILVALMLTRLRRDVPRLGTAFILFLLLTSGTYAVAGDIGYASMPRDEAADWLEANAGPNDTVEVYRRQFQDTAIPHGMNVNHAYGREGPNEQLVACPEYIELGYRDLLYLNDDTYYRNDEARKQYVRGLLSGEYNYEIAAEFGPRPPNFVPQRATPGSVVDLLRYGIVPHTDQYADEQELEPNQYTVILERTGPCDGDRPIPF